MNKRHIKECIASVGLWIRVWGSAPSEYMQFGTCQLNEQQGLNKAKNEWNSVGEEMNEILIEECGIGEMGKQRQTDRGRPALDLCLGICPEIV